MQFKILSTTLVLVLVVGACSREEVARAIADRLATPVIDDSGEVSEDYYRYYQFQIKSADGGFVKVSGRQMSGPAIDFVLMKKATFDILSAVLKSGGSPSRTNTEYYPALSSLNLSGQFSTDWGSLERGDYVYVVDNTDFLGAAPPMNFADDIARYSLKVEVVDSTD